MYGSVVRHTWIIVWIYSVISARMDLSFWQYKGLMIHDSALFIWWLVGLHPSQRKPVSLSYWGEGFLDPINLLSGSYSDRTDWPEPPTNIYGPPLSLFINFFPFMPFPFSSSSFFSGQIRKKKIIQKKDNNNSNNNSPKNRRRMYQTKIGSGCNHHGPRLDDRI